MAKLFKKDEKFFKIFGQMTVHILEASELLGNMVRNPAADLAPLASKIKDLEHKGDELTHRVIDELNKTFITPIDREDIHDLLTALDDIIDFIEAVAERVYLYKMTNAPGQFRDLANILVRCGHEVLAAITLLKSRDRYKEIPPVLQRIHKLENEGDQALRAALASLFRDMKDPIEIIKWKEVFENLETATDRCEDVANVLEGVALKYG